MQPRKKAGFFRRAMNWSMAGATGLALLKGTNAHAQQTTQPKAPQGLHITNVERKHAQVSPSTGLKIKKETNSASAKAARTNAVTINTNSFSQAAISAKVKLVRQGIGSRASGMNTNTMVELHDACQKVFATQKIAFGTNEMKGSMIALQSYLGKSPKLQTFWMNNKGETWTRAIEDVLDQKIVPNTADAAREARIHGIIIETSKLSTAAKKEILASVKK